MTMMAFALSQPFFVIQMVFFFQDSNEVDKNASFTRGFCGTKHARSSRVKEEMDGTVRRKI
jgi:hypothetical protein